MKRQTSFRWRAGLSLRCTKWKSTYKTCQHLHFIMPLYWCNSCLRYKRIQWRNSLHWLSFPFFYLCSLLCCELICFILLFCFFFSVLLWFLFFSFSFVAMYLFCFVLCFSDHQTRMVLEPNFTHLLLINFLLLKVVWFTFLWFVVVWLFCSL